MKQIFFYILLVIFLCVSIESITYSQPVTDWVRTYNSPGNYDDYITDMTKDKYGNLYICGYIKHGITPSDFVTLKYDNSGTLLWSSTYDGPDTVYSEDEAVAICVDDLGNVYVAGGSGSSLTPVVAQDYTLIKYNSNGDSIWVKRFDQDTAFSEDVKGMVIDNLGNVYIAGYAYFTDDISPGHYKILTVKYDSSGNLVWYKYFQSLAGNWAQGRDIKIDQHNNIFVLAGSVIDTAKKGAFTILKFDSAGNELDTFYYDTDKSEGGYKMEIDPDCNMYLGGIHHSNSLTNGNLATLKIDSTGQMIWFSIFDNSGSYNAGEYFVDFQLDNFRNTVIVCKAKTLPQPQLGNDYITIKYNQNGDSLWTRRYNSSFSSEDAPSSINIDNLNNIYVTGRSDFALLFNRYSTVKYSPSGELLWHIEYYPLFTNNEGKKILLDTLGNIYVTGISNANGTGWDIVTIKYQQVTGIQNNSNNIGKYDLKQNYPNPFNSITNIEFSIKKDEYYRIEVYDVLGRKVDELLNEYKKKGSYSINYNADKLSSGVYFYRLISPEVRIIKSFLLIK